MNELSNKTHSAVKQLSLQPPNPDLRFRQITELKDISVYRVRTQLESP